jgi:uncharacterized protein YhbP (UPF0306 family)
MTEKTCEVCGEKSKRLHLHMKKHKSKVAEEVKKDTTEIKVYDGLNLIRTYSKKEHGEDFEKLAEMYKSQYDNYKLVRG